MPTGRRRYFADAVAIAVYLEGPAQEGSAYGESSAYRGHQYEASLLQLAFFHSSLHGQRNRSGGGVAVAVDVDDYTFWAKSQAVGGGVDDAQVRLMRNECVDVGSFEAVAL